MFEGPKISGQNLIWFLKRVFMGVTILEFHIPSSGKQNIYMQK